MDTSKKYAQMCDCEEIQEVFFGEDRTWDLYPSYLYRKDIDRVCITVWTPKTIQDKMQLNIPVIDISIEYNRHVGEFVVGSEGELEEQCAIWLPRQDQLQEMVVDRYRLEIQWESYIRMRMKVKIFPIRKMSNFDYCVDGNSYEQLWLAFVMKELHNKIWKEGEWR